MLYIQRKPPTGADRIAHPMPAVRASVSLRF